MGIAQAQTLPDAGTLQQQAEQQRLPRIPASQVPEEPTVVPLPKAASDVVVMVRAFRFTGNTLLTDDTLQDALQGYRGRNLDFNELQRAAQAVAVLYRQAGWIVRSFLPRQDVTDGVVLIQIDEARFGDVRLEGEAPQRLKADYWQGIIAAVQPEGEFLSANTLDRALLLLDDLPGVTASGSLSAGQQPGQTDLLLRLVDEPLLTGNIGADNYGMRSTGSQRLTAVLSLNSPLQRGDRLLANLLYTEGNSYGRLSYSLPVGDSGLRLGANISNLDYQLVGQQFAAFDAEGSSRSWGFEGSYPLLRSRQQNLYLVGNLDSKHFDNKSVGISTAKYDVGVFSVGLIANRYDSWSGGGATEGSLFLSAGQVSTDDNLPPRADNSDGGFTKLRFGLARHQVLKTGLAFYAAWSAQWSDSNLDSSERFYLGGVSGIRAYPANEGSGAWGQMLNVELRQRLNNGWQLTGFLDVGQVRQYADNRDATGQRLTGNVSNNLNYKGTGLTLGWSGPAGLQLNATWSHRLGRNPNPAQDGRDQDGSLSKDRFWLNLSLPFEFGRPAATSN